MPGRQDNQALTAKVCVYAFVFATRAPVWICSTMLLLIRSKPRQKRSFFSSLKQSSCAASRNEK